MGHVAAARVNDKPLDSPDLAVGGMDRVAAAHGYLSQGNSVVVDGLREASALPVRAVDCRDVIGHGEHLFRAVAVE